MLTSIALLLTDPEDTLSESGTAYTGVASPHHSPPGDGRTPQRAVDVTAQGAIAKRPVGRPRMECPIPIPPGEPALRLDIQRQRRSYRRKRARFVTNPQLLIEHRAKGRERAAKCRQKKVQLLQQVL